MDAEQHQPDAEGHSDDEQRDVPPEEGQDTHQDERHTGQQAGPPVLAGGAGTLHQPQHTVEDERARHDEGEHPQAGPGPEQEGQGRHQLDQAAQGTPGPASPKEVADPGQGQGADQEHDQDREGAEGS